MRKTLKLNFLVIGSGAREHAIADKLKSSSHCNKLFLAGANDGFKALGEILEYENFEELAEKCIKNAVDITVVGPEKPLSEGIVDVFKSKNIKIVGTDSFWTKLESSKLFAKKFMEKHNIKTAKYKPIKDVKDIDLREFKPPYVIKADGLCQGKGVTINYTKSEAINSITENLNGKFGENSKTVIVEEFLSGKEISLICLFDGKTLLPFVPARDFKRLSGDKNSPNTGGMGAFCPVDLSAEDSVKINDYVSNLEKALQMEKADFIGFLYCGLLLNDSGIFTLEFNTRLGDPEAQALLSHLESDFAEILFLATERKLNEISIKWKPNRTACLVIASFGYPQKPKDNQEIVLSDDFRTKTFFGGVKKIKNRLYSFGGRNISLVETSKEPFAELLSAAEKIKMKNKIFRDDLTCD